MTPLSQLEYTSSRINQEEAKKRWRGRGQHEAEKNRLRCGREEEAEMRQKGRSSEEAKEDAEIKLRGKFQYEVEKRLRGTGRNATSASSKPHLGLGLLASCGEILFSNAVSSFEWRRIVLPLLAHCFQIATISRYASRFLQDYCFKANLRYLRCDISP